MKRPRRQERSASARRDYARLARVYDRLWSRYLQVSIARAVDRLPLTGAERLLDVGCGTGLLLARVRARRPEVELHGIDLTPQMLRRARRRLGPEVELREGRAEALPWPDSHFDVVVSTSVLHEVPHPHGPVVDEWLRVLRPGGALVVSDWDATHAGTRRRVALLRALGRRPELSSPSEVAEMLTARGVRLESVERHGVGGWGLWTVSGTAPLVA